jgi:hypothetical protein
MVPNLINCIALSLNEIRGEINVYVWCLCKSESSMHTKDILQNYEIQGMGSYSVTEVFTNVLWHI